MTIHRRGLILIAIAALAAMWLCAAAQASPLLSGYGGPGQGSQAILGSALVNGPPSGGGGSRGGGGGGGGAQSAPAAIAARSAVTVRSGGSGTSAGGAHGAHAPRAPSPARGRARGAGRGIPGHRAGATAAAKRGSAADASVLPSGAYPVSERTVAAPSGALGLSAGDLLGGLLVLCALGLTVVATRRLSAGSQPPGANDRQLGTEG